VEAFELKAQDLQEAEQTKTAGSFDAAALTSRAVLPEWVAPERAAPVIHALVNAADPALAELREALLAVELWRALGSPAGRAAGEFEAEELALIDLVDTTVGMATAVVPGAASLLGHDHLLNLSARDAPAMATEVPASAKLREILLEVELAAVAGASASLERIQDLDLLAIRKHRLIVQLIVASGE